MPRHEPVAQLANARVALDVAKPSYDQGRGGFVHPPSVRDEAFIQLGTNVLHVYWMPEGYKAKLCKLDTVEWEGKHWEAEKWEEEARNQLAGQPQE